LIKLRESKLEEAFKKVGLNIWVAKKPIMRTDSPEIFQMSIRKERGGRRGHFAIYCGEEKNEVGVLDLDKNMKQLLMLVKEPRRKFTYQERDPKNSLKFITKAGATDGSVRKYLMGLDESHYFIAQIPKGGILNKVRDAHKALRPVHLERKSKLKKSAERQGEWFFTPATKSELRKMEKLVKQDWRIFRFHELIDKNIGAIGTPHEAEFYIEVEIAKEKVPFVKGKIKHSDHKTLILDGWHRIFLNLEIREPRRNRSVYGWVD